MVKKHMKCPNIYKSISLFLSTAVTINKIECYYKWMIFVECYKIVSIVSEKFSLLQ